MKGKRAPWERIGELKAEGLRAKAILRRLEKEGLGRWELQSVYKKHGLREARVPKEKIDTELARALRQGGLTWAEVRRAYCALRPQATQGAIWRAVMKGTTQAQRGD